jgi:predicted permease
MDTLIRDLRYTLRSFRRMRRLSVAAMLCIAVGAGGAIFILTIANAVLRAGPPFPDADRLMRIWILDDATRRRIDLSRLDVRDFADRARSFDAIELAARTRSAISAEQGTERVRGESVTPGYFALIGIRPASGRVFTRDEYAPDADRVIVLGHGLWMRTFGGRPDIVGRTVRMRDNAGMMDAPERLFTVVGVMPPGFAGTVDFDVSEFWLPVDLNAPATATQHRRSRAAWVIARLRPGVAPEIARAEVQAIGRQIAAEHPDEYRNLSFDLEPLGETWRERFRAGLTMLTAAAVLLLFIACANIAYLLLARLAQRESELRIRAALGEPRGSLLRQLLLESGLLTLLGGAAGSAVAIAGVALFAKANLFRLPTYVPLQVDAAVVGVIFGVLFVTALLGGALPAWIASRMPASRGLHGIERTGMLGRRQRLTIDLLVTAEVAFSFVLLVGSALMVRTYVNLVRTDLGFRTGSLQRLAISLDPARYPTAESQLAFAREAKAGLAQLPAVRGVSFTAGLLPPWVDDRVPLAVRGEPRAELAGVNRHPVDEDFFRVLDIDIQAGRSFNSGDRLGSQPVAIVSRALARAIAPGDGTGAIGTTLQIARNLDAVQRATPLQIVGIAEDVRYHGPRAERTADHDLYVPMTQSGGSVLSIAVHTDGDPSLALNDIRQTLGTVAPTSPIHWISTMEEELGLQFGDARLYAWLIGVFGGSAILLVAMGVYGVISNAVTRRWSELGLRMAVGATPGDIVGLVMRQALRPMVLGITVGAVAALASVRVVASLVFGIESTDPVSFAAVSIGLLALGMVAGWLPARRASRLDPRSVLQRS